MPAEIDNQTQDHTPDRQMQDNDFLKGLNPEQSTAVEQTDGPLLVLAGAGTGKTKVLTTRIANILHSRKAFPGQILAVTFTNKAAKEMKERVENLLESVTDGLWLGTFHSIAARILRRHAEEVGLTKDFTIIDTDDQQKLAKRILRDFNIDEKKNPPKLLLYLIGRLKDKALGPDKVPSSEVNMFADGQLITLYREYQSRLKSLNAVDFGDLTLYNIELFNNCPHVFEEYQRKFKYILVDEYQDTNVAQYLWLRLLTQSNDNICCVGDDDQSIYGWRGAQVTNILRFDSDYPDATIIRLERNYRSTQHILDAASGIIARNSERHGKQLWTEENTGSRIKLNSFYDEREESRYIAEEISSLQQVRREELSDIAILVRAGYQTRSFEESLNFLRIPYKIIGGMRFYERAEIRDTLAYIRVLVNPGDNLAFERIINTPKRGIGTTTIQNMYTVSRDNDISLLHAGKAMIESGAIKGKTASALTKLIENFKRWEEMLRTIPHWQVVDNMLNESGYIEMWQTEGTEEAKDRLDNVKELLRALEDFTSLPEYLEHISLITDVDSLNDENKVNIMTMHSAKGLEFNTVFLAGWEEGLFPSQKTIDESGNTGLEEERRLAYVGITRAKQNLYISFACNRRIFGRYQNSLPSRFIDELPRETYEIINNFARYKSAAAPVKSNFDNEFESDYLPDYDTPTVMGITKGQRVFHQKFGYGIVINVSDSLAEVAFDKTNTKKVLIDYLTAG